MVTVDSLEAARKRSAKFFHLVPVDLMLPEGSGLDLLRAAKKASLDTMVIIFTAFASLETAITAPEEGGIWAIRISL